MSAFILLTFMIIGTSSFISQVGYKAHLQYKYCINKSLNVFVQASAAPKRPTDRHKNDTLILCNGHVHDINDAENIRCCMCKPGSYLNESCYQENDGG